jgi:RNA polymerase subunit RPABC4/transcription elongation factor Spt4
MSLRACKECGQQVSSDAKACPHCGKRQKRGFGLVAVLGIAISAIVGFAIIAGVVGAGLLTNKDATTRQAGPPFPPDVIAHIQSVYKHGTDFSEACARREGLGRIHASLLAFRSSTVSAIEAIDRAKFPAAYRGSASTLRRGLVSVRDGESRSLEYWRTGELSAIPDGEKQVQAGLAIINAEVDRMNNSR